MSFFMLYKFGTQYIQICMNDCLSILKQSRYFFYGQLSLDLDSPVFYVSCLIFGYCIMPVKQYVLIFVLFFINSF